MTGDGGREEGPAGDATPPGVDALQAAAQEVIDATRALLDVAETLVKDPDVVDHVGRIVRAASGAAARAARAADVTRREGPDDAGNGLEHIPLD